MQKIIPIALLAITAAILLTGHGALASSSKNVFNITVNCNNGAQAHKQASSSSNNVNVNVNCSSSGGTPGPAGPMGLPGKNGLNGTNGSVGPQGPMGLPGKNATVTIITTSNQTNSTTFNTKHFNCSSVAMLPFSCKEK